MLFAALPPRFIVGRATAWSRRTPTPTLPNSQLLVVILALPFVGSVVAAFLPTAARNAAALLAGVIAVVGVGLLASTFPMTAAGTVLRHDIPWLPSIGLDIVLRLDGLSWMFGMLVLAIGAFTKCAQFPFHF